MLKRGVYFGRSRSRFQRTRRSLNSNVAVMRPHMIVKAENMLCGSYAAELVIRKILISLDSALLGHQRRRLLKIVLGVNLVREFGHSNDSTVCAGLGHEVKNKFSKPEQSHMPPRTKQNPRGTGLEWSRRLDSEGHTNDPDYKQECKRSDTANHHYLPNFTKAPQGVSQNVVVDQLDHRKYVQTRHQQGVMGHSWLSYI
jgi:hypothetical protein